jgi:hypothetical protein
VGRKRWAQPLERFSYTRQSCSRRYQFRNDVKAFEEIIFGPCTLRRTWGTRPEPSNWFWTSLPRRGKGKRGGLRIIYYCFLSDEELWLLTLYDKNQAADLSKDEKEQLRRGLEAERAARKGKNRR